MDCNPIKRARKAKKMKATELASRLGVSSRTITAWETGKTAVSQAHSKVLQEVLALSDTDIWKLTHLRKNHYSINSGNIRKNLWT